MQYKELLKSLLIVHYSKDSRKPFASALLRIIVAYLGAIIFGLLIAKAVRRTDLPPEIPQSIGVSLAIGAGFLIGGLLMLTMIASQISSAKSSVFQKITRMMPLPTFIRWVITILPSILALGIVNIFGSLIIAAVAQVVKLPAMWLCAGWGMGLLSGYGLLLLKRPQKLLGKGMLYVIVVSAGLYSIDHFLNLTDLRIVTRGLIFTDILFLLPLIGFFQAYLTSSVNYQPNTNSVQRQLIPNLLPHSAWFLVKVWRNNRTRSSFFLALALNGLMAMSIILKHKTFNDPYGMLLFGGILSATFACDIRGVMRRYLPPEMVLLKGAKGIVWSEISAVLISGITIGLPMLFVLNSQAQDSLKFALFYFSLQVFCSLMGLFASTLIVPANGETGSQFFTGLIATSALVAFPKIAHLSNTAYADQSLHWLTAGLGIGVVVYITEIIRRKNYGRT